MNKIYDLTLGIEAGSLQEAEQKLLRFQQIAVNHSERNNDNRKAIATESDLSPIKAALGILAILGIGWVNNKLNPQKEKRRSADFELDMKLHKYNWQLECRKRRKREEEKQRKEAFALAN